MVTASAEITSLVGQLAAGDPGTIDALLPLVYDELRRIASRYMRREHEGHTLTTTALVHEVYLRLVDQSRVTVRDRAHFMAVAAIGMRRILVEHARKRATRERLAPRTPGTFEALVANADPEQEHAETLVALDDALQRLATVSPRLVRVVECRYFMGLTEQETAEALGVTDRTVRRDWIKAKGWLAAAMDDAR